MDLASPAVSGTSVYANGFTSTRRDERRHDGRASGGALGRRLKINHNKKTSYRITR